MTVAFYPLLPPAFASHWNVLGMTVGSMDKLPGLAIVPLIMVACVALFFVLPRIDPLRQNFEKFRNYYEGFVLVFVLYLFVIQALMILWNVAHPVDMNIAFTVLFGILFICTGFLLEHAEPNWFMGIRTPWTLSSPRVWEKTHQLGGKLFKAAGVLALLGVFFPSAAWLFALLPVLAASLVSVVYSYLEYRKQEQGAR
jgi:uncharacterized membrane protein